MTWMLSLALFAGSLVLSFGARAGETKPPENPLTAVAQFEASKADPSSGVLRIEMSLVEPYKAYLDRFKLAVEAPAGAELKPFQITPVVSFMDTFSKKMKDGIKKHATMTAKLRLPKALAAGSSELKVKLTYQACTTEHCLFPKHLSLTPTITAPGIGGVDRPSVSESLPKAIDVAAPAGVGGGSSEFEKALSGGILSAVLFMFVAGFLTSLTPCIYPMIPITLAILGATDRRQGLRADGSIKRSNLKSFLLSLFYVLGIATTYSALGVTAASTGALFGSALSNIWVVSGMAVLFVGMGLSMYGLFEIQAPAFIRDRLGQGKSEAGFFSSYMGGLAAGVVASPCIGPVLVSVLAYIAQTQNQSLGFVLLFSFAMGMGVLFMVLGTSSSLVSRIPKAGAWMDGVKFLFGTTMIAMALYYVAPVYPVWATRGLIGLAMVLIASAYGVFAPAETGFARVRKGAFVAAFAIGIALLMASTLEKSGFSVSSSSELASKGAVKGVTSLKWERFSEAALSKALAEKRPVIIDFWADWCGACHELEELTFPDARIQDLSKQYALFKIDATTDSPELEVLKKKYRVLGLPTMVFYDRRGSMRNDLTVTGFEKADAFLARMQTAQAAGASPAVSN